VKPITLRTAAICFLLLGMTATPESSGINVTWTTPSKNPATVVAGQSTFTGTFSYTAKEQVCIAIQLAFLWGGSSPEAVDGKTVVQMSSSTAVLKYINTGNGGNGTWNNTSSTPLKIVQHGTDKNNYFLTATPVGPSAMYSTGQPAPEAFEHFSVSCIF